MCYTWEEHAHHSETVRGLKKLCSSVARPVFLACSHEHLEFASQLHSWTMFWHTSNNIKAEKLLKACFSEALPPREKSSGLHPREKNILMSPWWPQSSPSLGKKWVPSLTGLWRQFEFGVRSISKPRVTQGQWGNKKHREGLLYCKAVCSQQERS